MNAPHFARRRAVITGGSRGIGFAVASLLHQQGASVLLVARESEPLKTAAAKLRGDGQSGQVLTVSLDLGMNREIPNSIIRLVDESLGGLDYLVNAAGGARVTGALEAAWDEWHEDFSVKFWGYFAMIRALTPLIQKNPEGGAVVNVVGVSGTDPNPELGIAGPVNAALRALTKVLAYELAASRIRIVNVHPGATETALLTSMAQAYARRHQLPVEQMLAQLRGSTPLGGLPSASDVGELICFLLSEKSRCITGTGIEIDGGAHHGLA